MDAYTLVISWSVFVLAKDSGGDYVLRSCGALGNTLLFPGMYYY